MVKLPNQYRRPVCVAIAIHLALLLFFIVHYAPKMFSAPVAAAPMQVIHATAIMKLPSTPNVEQTHDQKSDTEKVTQQKEQEEKKQLVEKKKEAEVVAKKALALKEVKLAKIQAAEKIKKEKALAQKKKQEKLAKAKAEKTAKAKKLLAQQKALQQKLMQQAMAAEQKNIAKADAALQSQAQQGAIDKYKAQILSLVESNWRIDRVNEKLKCVYSVSLAPDGTVLSASLVKSSGDDNLDQSARQAIMQSSPLPVPQDPAEFDHFRTLVLTLSPQGFVTG